MKRKIGGSARGGAARKGRKGARRCSCCECSPCACDRSCICQEMKAEETYAETQEGGFADDLHFSFLRFGELHA